MKKLSLFGAGDIGKQALEVLGKDLVDFFFVNQKKEDTICDVPVLTFDEFLLRKDEVYVIVSSTDYADEMVVQLEENGVDNYFIWSREIVEMFSTNQLNTFPRYSPLYCGDDWSGRPFPLIRSFFKTDFSNCESIVVYVYPETAKILLDLLKLIGIYDKVVCVIQHGIVAMQTYELIRGNFQCLLCAVCHSDNEISDNYEYIDNVKTINLYNVAPFLPQYHSPQIIKYKNAYKGKRCFIIGNGPSLRVDDLEALHKNNEICFACNSIYKMFDKTNWRPDFYYCGDCWIIKSQTKEILNIVPKEACLFNYGFCNGHILLNHSKNVIPIYHSAEGFSVNNMPRFSCDLSVQWYVSQSAYFFLQAAYYFGFDEIYLLGCDGYPKPIEKPNEAQHFYEQDKLIGDYIFNENNSEIKSEALDKSILFFKAARIVLEREGRKIFNATRGGYNEVFKRVSFDDLFSNEVK